MSYETCWRVYARVEDKVSASKEYLNKLHIVNTSVNYKQSPFLVFMNPQ